jgi:hypothetical protein
MTIIRNPIRASTRGLLRGPLQGKWGALSPLQQVLANPLTIEAWSAELSSKLQTKSTSTVAELHDDPVDQMDGLKGLYPYYSNAGTARPLLKKSSGITWIETTAANSHYLTTDSTISSGPFAMASAIGPRFVRVTAMRIVSNINGAIFFSGAETRADAIAGGGSGQNLSLYAGSAFICNSAHPGEGVDFVLTEDFNGASTRKFYNGVASGTSANPGSNDPNGLTIGCGRQASSVFSFASIRVYEQAVFSDYDADLLELYSGYAHP